MAALALYRHQALLHGNNVENGRGEWKNENIDDHRGYGLPLL